MSTVERFLLVCLRCGHKWLSKQRNPQRCAKCRSPYWNRNKVRK